MRNIAAIPRERAQSREPFHPGIYVLKARVSVSSARHASSRARVVFECEGSRAISRSQAHAESGSLQLYYSTYRITCAREPRGMVLHNGLYTAQLYIQASKHAICLQ